MSTNTAPVLELRGIRKAYPGVVALAGVDLALHAGEVHVLLGENGAGKSTLMKIISGAVPRDAGEMRWHGEPVEITDPRHARALGVAIIYQELNLVPGLTAAENIFLGREPRVGGAWLNQAQLVQAAQAKLDRLGVAIDARAEVGTLTIAERQMVEVAKAVSLNAEVMIMDEPTSALTNQEIAELFAAIQRLKARGVAIVYISHRMDELFTIGDRVTVLRDGRHVVTQPIAAVTRAQLVQWMVGRELTEQFPTRVHTPGEEALRVEHLSRKGLLDDVSFTLRRGEIVGLAGLMGSGRTSLARAIFGADPIDHGAIFVHGVQQTIDSPRAAIDRGLGLLSEDRKQQGLVLRLSVEENICLPSVARISPHGVMRTGLLRNVAQRRIAELRIKTPGPAEAVVNLSGGNQQKVVLAKWLETGADILLFDEPTRGIDVGAKAEIYELIHELAARGAAVLMISSELPELLGMSDRILVMQAGRIAAEFARATATAEKVLTAALGRN